MCRLRRRMEKKIVGQTLLQAYRSAAGGLGWARHVVQNQFRTSEGVRVMRPPLRSGNFGSVVATSAVLAGFLCGFLPAHAHDLPVPPNVAPSAAFEASFP